MFRLSVVLPTHRPDPTRLRRTLAGLRAQTLPSSQWETIIVDNASVEPVSLPDYAADTPENIRVVREPRLGLTSARRCGFGVAQGEFIVLVDDDNVLAPDYLEQTLALFAAHPRLGTIGGNSFPEFEQPPPAWMREFDGLLACRDLGLEPKIALALRDPATGVNAYPMFGPLGAGMGIRRAALADWLAQPEDERLSDRRGNQLTSGGDNDIILSVLSAGWGTGFFPQLSLTHLIPASRTQVDYLARLNRGIAYSWVQVLQKYDANPWPPIARWSVPLRKLKAWFTYRAWMGPAAHIRWQGACGHFEGRAALQP